ncbi:hypothetical protein T4B_9067 [Trichinella pseudospiralis]|uniref:Uncharacterized protein n=1 Tax=Trichinella pseudospiralis TaxID=6337 RepID=A0A0V1II73_TRIPS|nr:hypothetical protein T4B_9067 [Trichinella pseudospiralis]
MFFPFFNCISLCIPCPDIQGTYHRNAKHNTETQDQPKMNLICQLNRTHNTPFNTESIFR